MANLIVNYISEWLSKVIKNYSSDQLNISLLKGEVHLKDFEVDVNVINVYFETYVPFLRISKLSVSDVILKLPNYLGLKNKPAIAQIGHVDVECVQRDFSQPSAIELVGKEWFEMTAQTQANMAQDPDNEVYGLIKKVIDGVRIEIDSIHLVCKLDGLPKTDGPSTHSHSHGTAATNDESKENKENKESTKQSTTKNNINKLSDGWYKHKDSSKNKDASSGNSGSNNKDDNSINNEKNKFSGEPLIMEIWLIDCVICQTNSKWEISNDLRTIRKEQGTRMKDFCIYKLLTAKSFNIHFIPHPNRKDRIQTPLFLLQNYPISIKLITQRSASKGIVKSVSIDWLIELFHIYITRDEWFEINYFISSLIYAQSRQYEYELTQKNANREESVTEWSRNTATATDEPSININISTTNNTRPQTPLTPSAAGGGGGGGASSNLRKNSLSKNDSHTGNVTTTTSNNEEKKNSATINEENVNPDEENQHLTTGKNLFDSLSLCQPPRFQWNKLPKFTTLAVRSNRLCLYIMPDDWVCQPIPMIVPSRRQHTPQQQSQQQQQQQGVPVSKAHAMAAALHGNKNKRLSERFQHMQRVQSSSSSTTATTAASTNPSTPHSQSPFKPPPPTGKPPPLSRPPPPPGKPKPLPTLANSANNSNNNNNASSSTNNHNGRDHGHFSKSESQIKKDPSYANANTPSMSEHSGTMDDGNSDDNVRGNFAWTDSALANEDRNFLQSCNLMPYIDVNSTKRKYTHITIGDKFIYELENDDMQANSPRKHGHAQMFNGRRHTLPPSLSSRNGTKISNSKLSHKPLVMAVLSEFCFGAVFPDLGCSVWRTKIGKNRAEQFFSIQVRDMDILADTDLKLQIQNKIKTGFEQAVTQLQKESEKQEKVKEKDKDKEKEKETEKEKGKSTKEDTSVTTTEGNNEGTTNGGDNDNVDDDTAGKRGRKEASKDDSDKNRRRSHSKHKNRLKRERDRTMTLLISSRHYKAQTFESDFNFTIATPFPGYTSETMSVFNFQWTRRLPAPEKILGSISDMHIKPISIYLDPFLCYNVVSFYIGKGVLKCYQIQAALTTMFTNLQTENVVQRFVTRYQMDALKVKVPLNQDSNVSMDIFGLRLSSHDKLDESVHLRGLVDLSNFSNVGKESLRAMGLSNAKISDIESEKQKYYDEHFYDANNPAHQPNAIATGSSSSSTSSRKNSGKDNRFLRNYESRLSNVAPTVSKVLRAPDEYPWEIHIGHMQFASSIKIEGKPFDDQLTIQNCRCRWVNIRSDLNDLPSYLDDNFKPFSETQLSFRTEAIVGALDTSVIDELVKYLNFEDLSKLPFPALYKKIMNKLEDRQKLKLKLEKEKKDNFEKMKRKKETENKARKSAKRLKQSKSPKTPKTSNDVAKMDDKQLKEVFGENADVRRLSLSSEDTPDPHNKQKEKEAKNSLSPNKNEDAPPSTRLSHQSQSSVSEHSDLVDLDIFLDGVLDGMVPVDDDDDDDNDNGDNNNNDENDNKNFTFDKESGKDNRPEITPREDIDKSGGVKERSISATKENSNSNKDGSGVEMRLIVYSNLDRGEFELSNNGKKIIAGKSESQQGLFQWTQERINFHFFSKRFELFESPIGKYNERDVVTRFTKNNLTKRFWSEIIHEQADGALELSHPPSFDEMRHQIDNSGNNYDNNQALTVSNEVTSLPEAIAVTTTVVDGGGGDDDDNINNNDSNANANTNGKQSKSGIKNVVSKFGSKKKDSKTKSKKNKMAKIETNPEFNLTININNTPIADTDNTNDDNANNNNAINNNNNNNDTTNENTTNTTNTNENTNNNTNTDTNTIAKNEMEKKLAAMKNNFSNSESKCNELTNENDKLVQSNKLYFDFLKHMLAENRAMQVKILQLTSDLAMSRDDMARFVEQTTTDKIRIVEHQQQLVEDNLSLADKLRKYKSKIKELESKIPRSGKR